MIKGGVRRNKSSMKGVEATIWPVFPEAAEVGGIVVHVGAREDLDFIMTEGGSESPPPTWPLRPSLALAPTATSTTPPVP